MRKSVIVLVSVFFLALVLGSSARDINRGGLKTPPTEMLSVADPEIATRLLQNTFSVEQPVGIRRAAVGRFQQRSVVSASNEQKLLNVTATAAAPCGSSSNPFYLRFPLQGKNPYNAQINTVFDHVSPSYNNDGRIVAYTGEEGKKEFGKSSACYGACSCLCGMKNMPSANQSTANSVKFIVNGNYNDAYLYYDGHPGYDYQAGCGTTVYAAVSGTVHYPKSITGIRFPAAYDTFHVLEIVPDAPNDNYRIYYLHLATHISVTGAETPCQNERAIVGEGVHVNAGDPIGRVGQTGAPGAPHLHFEVQKNVNGTFVPVDPYGWQGQYADPNGNISTNLWRPAAYSACNVKWHPNGTLIRDVLDGNGTVWLIQGGQRRGIADPSTFYAYGFDFAKVINVTHDEFTCIPDGGILNKPPTPRLRKDGAVYEITDRGFKRAFPSAQIFQGLGFKWDDIQTLSVSGIADDPILKDTGGIYTIPYPDGTLLLARDGDDRAVYIVSDGKIKGFTSASAFLSLGYRFEDVTSVSGQFIASLPKGTLITDTSITQCSGKIPSGGLDLYRPGLAVISPNNGQTGTAITSSGNSMMDSTNSSPVIMTMSNTIVVSGTASDAGSGDNGIASVTVNGVRASADTASGTGVANWNRTLTLNNGTNTITVVATDNSGNQNSTTQEITINYQPPVADTTGPALAITNYSDGQTVSTSTITLSGTATDSGSGDNGISSVTVNGVRADGDTASEWLMANWSRTVLLNPGANIITVVAKDNSPNQNGTTQSITINLGGATPGNATTLAAGLSNPNGIATDGSEVFWTDFGSNSIKKVSVNGGPVTTLFSGPSNPSGIGVDSTYVYFGTGGDLQKIPKNGGVSTSLASGLVTRLVVDGTNVYWTNYSAGTVQKVPVNGGTVTTLASGLSSPMGITRAGNNVCWSEFNNPGAIRCVGINGGSVTVMGNNSNAPGIATDSSNLYWTENVFSNSGRINKVPISGGATTSLATGLNNPWDLAVDGASAYLVENNSSGVVKQVSLNGGTPIVLASGLAQPVAIAIDGSNVYWVERSDGGSGTGTLKKVAKGIVPNGGSPTASTTTASAVTGNSATLSGSVNPNGLATNAWFEVSTNSTFSSNNILTASQAIGAGTTGVNIYADLSGLTPNTTYYFRVVAANSAGTSRGVIQSFTTQSAPSCTYSISPASQFFAAGAGTGSVNVSAGNGCAWTATSNTGFLSVTSGNSGSGNGTVAFSVAANTGTSQRTGTMTVAGQTLTVTQDAAPTPPPTSGDDTVWVEDTVPTGGIQAGNSEGWNWISNTPTPFSGTTAHQSNIIAGLHNHYFHSATETLTVNSGEKLFAYVYIDPVNPVSELMLQWNDGTGWRNAYWGADQINTATRQYVGPLPAAGQWARLEVSASVLGLEGKTLTGMAFNAWNGRVTWDRAGKAANPTQTSVDQVWVEDSLPAGGVGAGNNEYWNWTNVNPAPYSGSLGHQSNIIAGLHNHYFTSATETLKVNAGDKLFAYVYIDPVNPVSELMLQWSDGLTWYNAYWGADQINTATRQYVGPLPAAGQWARLEVSASVLGLEGKTLTGMAFNAWNGRVTWDRAGKSVTPTLSTPEQVWVEDTVPTGGVQAGNSEGWNWISTNPSPYSQGLAHQSNIIAGLHNHYFHSATETLTVNSGEKLFAYVYIDPVNPVSELMLQWSDGLTWYNAYWGADQINTATRQYVGPLPTAGQWARLEVSASVLGLEGKTLTGMAFNAWNGRVTWDHAGKTVAMRRP